MTTGGPARLLFRVAVLAAIAGAGCAQGPVRQRLERLQPEPARIVLRNSTTRTLQSMRVQEDKDEGESLRLGSISPLLDGQSFVLERATNAPRLPARARVFWSDAAGLHSARMSIVETLRRSSGQDALVFDLQPPGVIRVYLENGTR